MAAKRPMDLAWGVMVPTAAVHGRDVKSAVSTATRHPFPGVPIALHLQPYIQVIIMAQRRNAYSILIVAFVALGSLTFGYSNVIIGTTLAQPTFMYVVKLVLR